MLTTAAPAGTGFRRYLGSAALSYLGDGVRAAAFPLLAVSLTASPAQVAAVTAAGTLPWLVLGLHAGVVADRLPRVPLMAVLQAVRALAGAATAAGVLTGRLGIAGLIAAAAVLGVCEVYVDVAAHAVLPELLPADRLQPGNARLVAAEVATSDFAGPALGGVLFAVSAALPIGLDAATFLGSALLLAAVPARSRPRARSPREPAGRELAAAARWFLRVPLIRTLTVLSASVNLGSGGVSAVLALFVTQRLGVGPAGYGLLVAVGAAGAFAGGLLAERLTSGARRRAAVAGTAPFVGGCFAVLAVAPGPVPAAAAMVLVGFATSAFNVVAMSLRQARTPGEMLGRVVAVHRVVCWGALPVGALGAGVAGSVFGLRWAIGACALAVLVTWVASVPLLRRTPVGDYRW